MYIGYHEAVGTGYEDMVREGLDAGGDTFAFFTRNPRGGAARRIDEADEARARDMMEANHFGAIVAHAPYTMNPCSSKSDLRSYARDMLSEDLVRLSSLPHCYYNLHPGCHTGQGEEAGIAYTAETIGTAWQKASVALTGSGGAAVRSLPVILIETMAGKGSEIGTTFEGIRAILDAAAQYMPNEMLGVCLDTCHVWDAGYDIAGDLDGVLAEFDKVVGLGRLHAVHLNDSKNERGAHKDRHERLGLGCIGGEALRRVVCHSALHDLPFILETPNDIAGYADEIKRVRAWACGKSPISEEN